MTIRFLMTTASQHPAYPFQAGQEISLSSLTPDFQRWISEGRAEVVREEPEVETSMLTVQDTPKRSKARRAVHA